MRTKEQLERASAEKDPIAMYDLGVAALKRQDFIEAYVWYKLSSEYIEQWGRVSDNKRGEERFNESYLVMDIGKVRDEVRTNLPLVRGLLSDPQRQQAEIVFQKRQHEIERH